MEECSQPECGIGRPLATMRLVRVERCFHSVFREHRSTEASSVVAARRYWLTFWWRTSLDGGKPRRGGKSPRGYLTSYHSTQGRRGRKSLLFGVLHRSRRTNWRCTTDYADVRDFQDIPGLVIENWAIAEEHD